jgi:HK97 family phage prohead protease
MSYEYIPYFELKEVNEDGTFVGIASVYGVEDLGGDVIDKGAFKKTISENPSIPILWQHKRDEVIGMGTVKEWQGKILLEGALDLEDPMAHKAYGKMKRKLIKGLSIGFSTIKNFLEEVEGRTIRHISELKLWEVSIVTFPMLPQAQVSRVKSAEEDAARIKQLEDQLSALQAKQDATPVAPEPVQAEEPHTQQSTEPAKVHSELSVKIQAARRGFTWPTTTNKTL